MRVARDDRRHPAELGHCGDRLGVEVGRDVEQQVPLFRPGEVAGLADAQARLHAQRVQAGFDLADRHRVAGGFELGAARPLLPRARYELALVGADGTHLGHGRGELDAAGGADRDFGGLPVRHGPSVGPAPVPGHRPSAESTALSGLLR